MPMLVNGFIQFTVAGGVERRSGFGTQTSSAVKDENSVIILKNQAPAFEELRVAVEEAIANLHRPAPATATSTSGTANGSLADELGKLQHLADSGVLTPDELAAAKARLLGSRQPPAAP